jgi:hypothetical protein
MRYIKTVDLWDHNTAHMVRTGQLRLQAGQWVRCGQEQPSRFVKIQDSGVIVAAHPQDGNTRRRFEALCKIYLKSQKGGLTRRKDRV